MISTETLSATGLLRSRLERLEGDGIGSIASTEGHLNEAREEVQRIEDGLFALRQQQASLTEALLRLSE